MKLTQFIQENQAKIIAEWVAFASTIMPWAKSMTEKDLQDHAAELLVALVRDMKSPQSRDEQVEKSQGVPQAGALALIGHKHASQRMATGFNLDQLVSEYRALRASILRLWAEHQGDAHSEVTRFNEAIDESLTEATIRYSQILDHTREQFLAILGHDLRNPLSAITMGATLLSESETLDDKGARVAARILTSAGRMDRMVSDLLDLTRTRLGAGIPVSPRPMDLGALCQQVIAELGTIHPACELRFTSEGNLLGEWDHDRVTQVVSNLVANALEHGGDAGPVTVFAQGNRDDVVVQVRNGGPSIPAIAIERIFDPMFRDAGPKKKNSTGMGLGLYIAREVVTAHGGTIEATSSPTDGTTFTVRMPRHPAANATLSA